MIANSKLYWFVENFRNWIIWNKPFDMKLNRLYFLHFASIVWMTEILFKSVFLKIHFHENSIIRNWKLIWINFEFDWIVFSTHNSWNFSFFSNFFKSSRSLDNVVLFYENECIRNIKTITLDWSSSFVCFVIHIDFSVCSYADSGWNEYQW